MVWLTIPRAKLSNVMTHDHIPSRKSDLAFLLNTHLIADFINKKSKDSLNIYYKTVDNPFLQSTGEIL